MRGRATFVPLDLVDWLAAEMKHHCKKPEVEAFGLSMIFRAAKIEQEGSIQARCTFSS